MLNRHSIARCHVFGSIATAVALATGLTFPLGLAARGAPMTDTWNNTSTDYNAPTSYQEGLDPTGNITTFAGAADTSHQPNVTANISVSSVLFGTTSADTGANGYLLSANPGVSLTVTSGITSFATSGSNTVSADLTLGAAASKSVSMSQATGGNLIISGDISQLNANTSISLPRVATSSPFFVTLSGDNTFTGGISFPNNGINLNINSATAIGTGALNIGSTVSPAIDNTSGAAITLTNNNAISFSGTGTTLTFKGTNDLSFGTGAVSITGANRILSINGSTLTLNGNITEDATPRSVTKAGIGRLVLGGTDTYSGGTNVTNGVLTVNGSLAGTVNVSGNVAHAPTTLAGANGSFGGAVAVAVNTSNFTNQISPGDGLTAGSIGHLSFASSLDIEGSAILDLNKSGALLTNDEFLFTGSGALTLGAGNTLALNFAGDAPSDGDTWTIASGFGSRSGAFNTPTVTGLPVGDAYAINYNDLDHSITVSVTAPTSVPEPASLALLGLGAVALLRRRRF
jgi:fibronectin-binding autotransporter adhesin